MKASQSLTQNSSRRWSQSPYIRILKLRMVFMVLVIVAIGYFLSAKTSGEANAFLFIWTLVGTGLASAGAFVLNQYAEIAPDGKMKRTCSRPIPSGEVSPTAALLYGTALTLAGVLSLHYYVNLMAAFLTLLICFMYVLVYTPLKLRTWLNTPIGAIPGAIPPMVGWVAANGGMIEPGAWILFLILFLWQHPHFYAIAWLYREDYKRGGFKMLPVVEPDGAATIRQILFYALAIIPVSLVPYATGMSGWIYLVGATFLGVYFLANAVFLAEERTNVRARKLLYSSLIYLPAFLILIVVDSQI